MKLNRWFQQLDAMISVILFQCRPDEAEIRRWYIQRKQYDFVIYNDTNSDVIQLTKESDIWSNMEPGTRVVMRVITEEVVVDSTVTATYKCPCERLNTINVDIGDIGAIWRSGCTITWWVFVFYLLVGPTMNRKSALRATVPNHTDLRGTKRSGYHHQSATSCHYTGGRGKAPHSQLSREASGTCETRLCNDGQWHVLTSTTPLVCAGACAIVLFAIH